MTENTIAAFSHRAAISGRQVLENRLKLNLRPSPSRCRQMLDDEIEQWQQAGRKIRLCLRDDDAAHPTPALQRLCDFCQSHDVPVLLAIIPARAVPELAETLEGIDQITPAAHGFAHVNHAETGFLNRQKKEMGGKYCADQMIGELAEGRQKLGSWFGDKLSAILVPPWNNIDPEIAGRIGEAGFSALSCHGWRKVNGGPPRVNTHVDIVDWANQNRGHSLERIWYELAQNLKIARLSGFAPVGILSHHLAHDEQAWRVLEALASDDALNAQAEWVRADILIGA